MEKFHLGTYAEKLRFKKEIDANESDTNGKLNENIVN